MTGSWQAQELIPLARIRSLKTPEEWEAAGKDPQFLVRGKWPEGWTEVSWSAAADYPLRLRLYLDRGRGFNDLQSIDLGVVSSGERKAYSTVIPLGVELKGVRLDPGETAGKFVLSGLRLRGISRFGMIRRALGLFFREEGVSSRSLGLLAREVRDSLERQGARGIWLWSKRRICPPDSYELWIKYTSLSEEDKAAIKSRIESLNYKPTFSVVVPVYNVAEKWLRRCIESVLAQLYPYWELCIADDKSTDPAVRRVLEEYRRKDSRIKVIYREKNGHISAASNSALELAGGEFIALLDNDDELTPDALYENALLLNKCPDADMIYSDEDKISEDGERNSPFFKPDWSPDTFLSQMYTCHLGVYRTELVRQIGGFRLGLEGSQDYDLVLRLTEKTGKIYHIPKVLYHWRTIPQSTAGNSESKSYAYTAGEKGIQEALDRRGEQGRVTALSGFPGQYLVSYPVRGEPLISIIIPTRDKPELLARCLNSVFDKTRYRRFEVVVADNGSAEQKTKELLAFWQEKEPERFRVIPMDIPFNYARINNAAAASAKGELILLLNNDMEVISSGWLEEMAGQAQRPGIGAVGAVLYYPDDSIQHAGVTLGLCGVAGHGHKGFYRNQPGYFGRLLIDANYAAVTGACLMVRKEVYTAVGGLDEALQVDFNDVDFCLKLIKKGLYNVVVPQAQLYHFESQSRGQGHTGEELERLQREVSLMRERWGEMLTNDPFYNPNLSLEREDFSVAVPPRQPA